MLRTIFSMRLGLSSSEEPAPLQSWPTSKLCEMQKLDWPLLTCCILTSHSRELLLTQLHAFRL